MDLLTGPAGSGKSYAVLSRIRDLLRRRTGFRLLVPTATMAEHVRNALAREGFVFSPGLVQTFTRFVSQHLDAPALLPAGGLEFTVRSCLAARTPKPFSAVAGFTGFERALAALIVDCSSAGCDAARLRAAGLDHTYLGAFIQLFEDVEQALAARGWCLRGTVLIRAAHHIEANRLPGIEHLFLDGFFQFTGPELDLIAATARSADVTVTLPDWPGAAYSRGYLLERGFVERRFGANRRSPKVTVLEAPSIASETEAVAARILEAAGQGRNYRDIGVVVRGDNAHVSALRTTFARAGIPAAFLFAESASANAVLRYLAALVQAMLGGWDHAATLAVLRANLSGLGGTRAGDQLDYRLRQLLPGKGLAGLADLPGAAQTLARLEELDAQFGGVQTAAEWAERCRHLRPLVELPASLEPSSHPVALLWRSIPAALDAFDAAAEDTAIVLAERPPMPFAEFWAQLQLVLDETALRVPDRRRDVVHVMDAYEARQWDLPVVFVCGLIEKEFPRYHPQDPVLPDAIRLMLHQRGIRLRSSADYQLEEDFLFDLATTRATSQLYLCYPRYNADGDENLRSFLLDAYIARHRPPVEKVSGLRFDSHRHAVRSGVPSIADHQLRHHLALHHNAIAATAVESYLQCAYQFFARNSLRLQAEPPPPEERLDVLAQGNIVHAVLARYALNPERWRAYFDSCWTDTCKDLRVPPGYRTESVRLELIRNLEMVVVKLAGVQIGKSEVERRFTVPLTDELAIKGKIDRLIYLPDDDVLILDYKYSSPQNVSRLAASQQAGLAVQGGLYMIGAEEAFNLRPAGFLYCGAKKEVTWQGWHRLADLPLVSPCEPQQLRLVMEQARAQALGVHRQIGEGRIAPRPADRAKCRYCEFAGICRRDAIPAEISAGEAGL